MGSIFKLVQLQRQLPTGKGGSLPQVKLREVVARLLILQWQSLWGVGDDPSWPKDAFRKISIVPTTPQEALVTTQVVGGDEVVVKGTDI